MGRRAVTLNQVDTVDWLTHTAHLGITQRKALATGPGWDEREIEGGADSLGTPTLDPAVLLKGVPSPPLPSSSQGRPSGPSPSSAHLRMTGDTPSNPR